MRLLLAIALIATCATGAERRSTAREHRKALTGKRTLAGVGAGTVLQTARNRPYEWGRGAAGVAKRFGSGLAQHAVKHTIQFGVAAWRHENLRYRPSGKRGTWPRVGYAVKRTFVVPRAGRPGTTLAVSRLSGNFGAGMISRLWQPASAASVGAGVASGGIGVGADVGLNVAREFWPRKPKVATSRRPRTPGARSPERPRTAHNRSSRRAFR